MNYLTFFSCLLASFTAFAYADDGINTVDYSSDVYDYLKELTEFCQVSYCISEVDRDAFKIGELDCSIDFCTEHPEIEVLNIFVAPLNESGTNYVLLDHTKKRILVVFRGSSTIFDWIADLTFLPTKYTPLTTDGLSNYTCDDCEVHEGFYNTLKQYSDSVFPLVKSLKEGNYSDYQVVTTGHSLGGALTNLAGIEFLLMGYDPLVLSIAGPKVANDKMADYMNKIFDTDTVISDIQAGKALSSGFIRVVHQGDIVPLLPPTDYFWHGGAEFYIDKFLLPHPQSVTYFRGDYNYESITESEANAFIASQNYHFIYDHISYFVSTAACQIGNVFSLFGSLRV